MNPHRQSILFTILFVATIFSGCGTSYLEVSRVAGYVGTQRGKMYVVNIEGKDAGKFQEELYEALSDDGHFTTARYGVVPPQDPDSATNIPSIILSGIHSSHQSTNFFTEESGEDKKKYKQRTESHEFQYSIRDAVTGEELEANVIRHDNVGEKEEDTGFLSAVVEDAVTGLIEDVVGVESAHRRALIRDFVARLRLHSEKRVVILFQDEDIPELAEGVKCARNGDWAAAIARFQAGAENHPESAVVHKAYFNLGVAFEYNHEFDKALTSLQLAHELAPQEAYAAEYDHCKWFARQYRWQQRYAGSSLDAAR